MTSSRVIKKVRLPVSLWLSLFFILLHCTDYVDWKRQEKAQATLIAALSRIGATQTAEQPERYFVNNEETIAAEEYLADMAEYLSNNDGSKESNQQWLKAAISYSAPSALDFESELSALRTSGYIYKNVTATYLLLHAGSTLYAHTSSLFASPFFVFRPQQRTSR